MQNKTPYMENKIPYCFVNQMMFYFLKKNNISPLNYASKDLETLLELKKLAKIEGNHALANRCEEIELEKFPITQEEINANKEVEKIIPVFRMVGLITDKETIYQIIKTLELNKKKKDKFDDIDASKIIADSKIFFLR